MNDQNLGAKPFESFSPHAPFKDRSTGLIVFGILTLLLGCLIGLFMLMMVPAMAAANRSANSPAAISALLPVIGIYGVLAVTLIWLGIGSIMARRWARALLLIFSWSWLAMGLICLIVMGFILPKTIAATAAHVPPGQPALPAGAMSMILVFVFLFMGGFFVILPAVWVFFYKSPHVKTTCENRDPVIRWTDACPLPVLGLCLWLAISVPMMLIMPIAAHGVTPFFGIFLSGFPGSLFYMVVAAVWGYSAWLLYQLDQRGWWLILIAMGLFLISTLATYARHDVVEMYQLMGYPEAQIDQMKKTGLLVGHRMQWMTLLSMLPIFVYLLFIRKYFQRKA